MIFTNGEKCIVCDKSFAEDDDIVICPHCGTPHHRECYNQLGHCANQNRHNENRESKEEEVSADAASEYEQQDTERSGYYYSPDSSVSAVICKKCGAQNDSDAAFCSECGERLDNSFNSVKASPTSFAAPYNEFGESDELIDDKSVSDISAVVGTNSRRFVSKFKSGKKISWNWGAFIFSGYYFMFRKMYKEGALIIALKLAITLFVQGAYTEKISSYMSVLSDIVATMKNSNEAAVLSNEIVNKLTQSYIQLAPMIIIMLVSLLIISIVCGLFADSFYKKKVFSVLDKIETNLANGGSFGVNPMFNFGEELTQEQMRTLFLNKLGGVSFFAPITAYLVLEIITNFIIPSIIN